MTSFRQVFRLIGSPAAVSWPTFWVSLAFNFFLAFVGSFDEVSAPVRLMVVIASQSTMFGLLLLCRVSVLRSSAEHPRPWRTLGCFVAAGIVRSLTAGAVLVAFLGPDSARLGFRVAAGVVTGLVVFVPTTIIVASWRSYHQRRAELLSRRSQLSQAAEGIFADIAERDRAVVDRVRAELDEVLQVADPGPELQRWSVEVVRPLSHQLAAATPEWVPPMVAPARVRLMDVLRRSVAGAPLMPVTTSVTVAVIGFVAVLLSFGWLTTLVFTVGVIGGGSALLWLANRLLGGADHWPFAARALVLFALLALSGWLVGSALVALLPDRDTTFFIVPATAVLFTAFGAALAVARALSSELRDTLRDLQEVDDQLAWQVARLRLLQWAQGLRFARALHGPVQGSVAVAVVRLREAPGDQSKILTDLRESLLRSLDSDDVAPSWNEGVDRLRRSWDGVCAISVTTREECTNRLDSDPACREMALEIVTEAVSNAVRHGHATEVTAVMACEGDRMSLVVLDNGQGAGSGLPGLGTRVLNSCTLEWSRNPVPGATELRTVLPVQPA